jgi:hypothetical protein
VTADHGMNGDGHHGGTADIERDVPFYYFGAGMVRTAARFSISSPLLRLFCRALASTLRP